ncbi:P-loop containing nucleoside triphosphate hydrolase protein [Favolaschia claudopus]|uniref:P-loop containing nucleoside triphosphate hydrolase protein n=1 Tax=Favolaschia claudopus TaxID=2862362 RepID=A0AAW0E7D4_9AGAR
MDPYSRSRYEQGIDSKIVIMGNSGVGKTSLLQRYTLNKFDPKNTTSTSGAFFVTKKIYVNGLKVRLQLWDTAGQERFRSMAPMYYRGANAALLLYDITNASTFDDIRGWLEELKKNCEPELLIYIVGSKADLSPYRQVTSDLARLSLHNWFPPPRPPTPPPLPAQHSTLSYIRPRFTSFPGLSRAPLLNAPTTKVTPPPAETPAYLDLDNGNSGSRLVRSNTSVLARSNSNVNRGAPGLSRSNSSAVSRTNSSALSRSNSSAISRSNSSAISRANSSTAGQQQSRPSAVRQQSRFGSHFGAAAGGWAELQDSSSNSLNEDDENAVVDTEEEEDEPEWGLSRGMELFEVSAKDDVGIQNLFDHLIAAIILKKDRIEKENELKKRDSVFLSASAAPAWSAQAEEEEAREKAERERVARAASWGGCC